MCVVNAPKKNVLCVYRDRCLQSNNVVNELFNNTEFYLRDIFAYAYLMTLVFFLFSLAGSLFVQNPCCRWPKIIRIGSIQ